jgi:hypothetical protein
MKKLFIVVAFMVLICGVVFVSSPRSKKESPAAADKGSVVTNILTNQSVVVTNWPDDPRPEVQEVYQFARIARPYDFDPHIVYYDKDKTLRNTMDVITKTHSSEVDTRSHRIRYQYSYHDDSSAPFREVDLDPAEMRKSWADSVGTWNKQEMIDETIRILRELGYTEYLAIAQTGKFEFKVHEYMVKTPDGQQTAIHPFATVTILDAHGPRVTAEYRMGTNGKPAGLTHWMAQ